MQVASPIAFSIDGDVANITPNSTEDPIGIVGVPLTLPVVAGNARSIPTDCPRSLPVTRFSPTATDTQPPSLRSAARRRSPMFPVVSARQRRRDGHGTEYDGAVVFSRCLRPERRAVRTCSGASHGHRGAELHAEIRVDGATSITTDKTTLGNLTITSDGQKDLTITGIPVRRTTNRIRRWPLYVHRNGDVRHRRQVVAVHHDPGVHARRRRERPELCPHGGRHGRRSTSSPRRRSVRPTMRRWEPAGRGPTRTPSGSPRTASRRGSPSSMTRRTAAGRWGECPPRTVSPRWPT